MKKFSPGDKVVFIASEERRLLYGRLQVPPNGEVVVVNATDENGLLSVKVNEGYVLWGYSDDFAPAEEMPLDVAKICYCAIKDLMTNGHWPNCPEKRK